jgi:spore maturation protein CgeB
VFSQQPLDLVIVGRSILSSVANPSAQLFRGLINELAHRGHRTTYLEPADAGQRRHRDMLRSPYCEVWVYESVDTLVANYGPAIQSADVVMLTSGLPGCDRIAQWIAEEARGITTYFDTDLPLTLRTVDCPPGHECVLSGEYMPAFHLYLSTTGGTALERLGRRFGIPCARPLYQCIDPFAYYRMDIDRSYDLGFIGNYHGRRDEQIQGLLLEPARLTPNRPFALAGDGYPTDRSWPENLTYLEHLPKTNHVDFFNRLACTLVIEKTERREVGFTPTRQLLAAAACGVPVLCKRWEGIEDFLEPQREIYCVENATDVLHHLYGTDEALRQRAGLAARERVLAHHTAAHRAQQLLDHWSEVAD